MPSHRKKVSVLGRKCCLTRHFSRTTHHQTSRISSHEQPRYKETFTFTHHASARDQTKAFDFSLYSNVKGRTRQSKMIPRFATIPLLVCMGVATRAAAFTLLRSDTTTTKTLPPVLQHITDERAEFQINLGRAMDTLKTDMPEILSRPPST